MRVIVPILAGLLLIAAAPDSGPSDIEPDAPAATPADEAAQTRIVKLINRERANAAADPKPLKTDPELTRIARARSYAMAVGRAPFDHDDGHGRYPAMDMVRAVFGPYGFIGENIFVQTRNALGFAPKTQSFDSGAFAETAAGQWMKSPEHRDNILSSDYDSTGVGVVTIGDHTYATQVFRGDPPPPIRAKAKRVGPEQQWLEN